MWILKRPFPSDGALHLQTYSVVFIRLRCRFKLIFLCAVCVNSTLQYDVTVSPYVRWDPRIMWTFYKQLTSVNGPELLQPPPFLLYKKHLLKLHRHTHTYQRGEALESNTDCGNYGVAQCYLMLCPGHVKIPWWTFVGITAGCYAIRLLLKQFGLKIWFRGKWFLLCLI